MATTNLNIPTDTEVKAAAEQLFHGLGLNLTTAINLFLRQSLRTGGLPFDVEADIPNETTLAALAEGRKLLKDPTAKGYHSMEALRAALDV